MYATYTHCEGIYFYIKIIILMHIQYNSILNFVIIGSGNGLSPVWRQVITRNINDLLSNSPTGTQFTDIWIKMQRLISQKCIWKFRVRNVRRKNVDFDVLFSCCMMLFLYSTSPTELLDTCFLNRLCKQFVLTKTRRQILDSWQVVM